MKKYILFLAGVLLPAVTYAASVISIIETVKGILDLVIPIVITLAVIYFFWGLAQYIINTGSEEKRTEARNIMIYGIIILFVMLSVWGLVGVLGNTFGVGQGGSAGSLIPSVR